jgi:hypothetical protein
MKKTTILLYFLLLALSLGGILACNKAEQGLRKIRQSNKVFEDNVNGRIASGNVEESTNFYYNANGSLGRVTVYDDTTVSATLLKDITVEYQSDKVVLNTFHYIDGYRTLYLFFNSKNQITELVDTLGNGLYFNYANDKITGFNDSSGLGVLRYVNFVYDGNNNLLQYEVAINNDPPLGRALLEYSSNPVTEELDTRFFNKDIKFIYIGGLNLVTKLGLNFGLSNGNTLTKRTEVTLPAETVVETYVFGYIYNSNQEIVKRNMRWSTDTLFYQFKY